MSQVANMPLAYILLTTGTFSPNLIKKLRSIKGVEAAYPVYGVYDIIVKAKANTMPTIKEIHNNIRKLEGVKQTLTMLAHEE
jgi:DNA-binding Lrp family transcriptional regulator